MYRDAEKRKEAIRLRTVERKSLFEISKQLSIAKGTASGWLRLHRLSKKELENRRRTACKKSGKTRRKNREALLNNIQKESSKFYKIILKQKMSSLRKGKISEAAILFRLLLYGFEVYSSFFDGERIDFVVRMRKRNRFIRVQVRTIKENKYGSPVVSLRCTGGRKKAVRLSEKDFDFVVGYDLFHDKAYVFSKSEIKNNKTMYTIKKEAEEAWYKLKTAK